MRGANLENVARVLRVFGIRMLARREAKGFTLAKAAPRTFKYACFVIHASARLHTKTLELYY